MLAPETVICMVRIPGTAQAGLRSPGKYSLLLFEAFPLTRAPAVR